MSLRRFIYNNHWTLGFYEGTIEDLIGGQSYEIRWLNNPYKNRWFADPFLLNVSENIIDVLVEEFYDPINRGRISRLLIDRKSMSIQKIIPILELPNHLSFPAILKEDGQIFIYPENSESGRLDLYQINPIDNSCVYVRTLCELPLTDAIITSLFDERLLFSTHLPSQNGSVLTCYKEKDGAFIEKCEMTFNSNIARNAGDWFQVDGVVYRPAQDCNKRYGGAVIIQKVTKTGNSFCFNDVVRLEEIYGNYSLGCHTLNYLNGVAVIDVNGYRRPFLASIMKAITSFKKRIFK